MRAIILEQYGPPSLLTLQEVPKPVPTDDEILVKINATAINDWDWNMVRGKPLYMHLFVGVLRPKIRIPGAELAGVIETVGKNVATLQPGMRVYGDVSMSGFGGFAEYVCLPADAVRPMPENMSFVDAAAIPHAALLALQGLRLGGIEAGQKLLINGAGGGVGALGVQIAKSMGNEDITGVDHTSKLDMMREAGYTHVIDYTQTDFTKAGERYDFILDTKSTRGAFAYTRALKPNGRYITVGGHTGSIYQVLLFGPLIRTLTGKTVKILGLKPNEGLDDISALFEAGALKPIVEGPYPLDHVPRAIQDFGDATHKGKIVIAVGEA